MEQKNMLYEGLYLDYLTCVSEISKETSSRFVKPEDMMYKFAQKYDIKIAYNLLLNSTKTVNEKMNIFPDLKGNMFLGIFDINTIEDLIGISTIISGGISQTVDENNKSLLCSYQKIDEDKSVHYYIYNTDVISDTSKSLSTVSDLMLRYMNNDDGSVSSVLLFRLDGKPSMIKISQGDKVYIGLDLDLDITKNHPIKDHSIRVLSVIKEKKNV